MRDPRLDRRLSLLCRPAVPAALVIVLLALPALLAAPILAAPVPQADDDDAHNGAVYDDLHWRHVGPIGNRVIAVVGVPGERGTYFIGAASGGVFRTYDGGVNWEPVFDDQTAMSVGSLAIAPSDPNVIWAGTGETFVRSNISVGNGIYKSTDGGDTWEHAGLEGTGRIGRIVIHPTDPDIVFAAAMGHLYGPQEERGVFRTTDGGETWQRVLFVDENTGASDIAMHPGNPRILYAGTWPMLIRTWGRWSGGPGGGLFRSTDGGDSWDRLEGRGLPSGPTGKVGLSVTPADPDRVYALIETNTNRDFAPLTEHQGVLWRTDNAGDTWRLISSDHTIVQRPNFYTRGTAAPDDADEIHFMATAHTRSRDGGASIEFGGGGGDNHDMWIDPLLPDRMIIGHDGGVSISENRGATWFRPPLPIAQMYHVAVDDQIPYNLYGNRQDGSSFRGPSNTLTGGGIPFAAWHSVGGCESGFAIPDPVDNNIVWSGCYEGILDRYDARTGHTRNVSVWPDNPEGWGAGPLRYRLQWTFPIHISPHDHNVVYVGSQHVHRTTNGGQSWEVISPDLTTNDKTKQEHTGGLTHDDVSPTYAVVLFAIKESPVEPGVIWAGSNDGLVHVTRDGGETWTNVTDAISDLPPWGTISNIEASRFEAGKAYLTADLHQVNDTRPYVYRTTDYGATWTYLGSDLPQDDILGYAHVIREDPVRPELLYVGTENSVWVSFDDGATWRSLQIDLPHAPAHWLEVQERFNDLVVATYGRGFWILDDVTPLQQLTDEVRVSDVHLFEPRPAYRFNNVQGHTSRRDEIAGENPRPGASLSFWLREVPEGRVSLRIESADGEVVRDLGPQRGLQSGINRVSWNLRLAPSDAPRLRTEPLEHVHADMPDSGWRPLVEGGRVSPLAPPGTYTVRLIAGENELTQELVVLKDPNSTGSEADIAAQTELVVKIRGAVDDVVDLIDEIEWLRRQIDELQSRLADGPDFDRTAEVLEAASALDAELIELEGNFFDLRLSGGTAFQDGLWWPRRLYSKLGSLARYVSGADFAPTDQHLEVWGLYQEQLAAHQARMQTLHDGSIAALNALLREVGVPHLGR